MNYLFPKARIAILAKAPIPGTTKTRMQPELSPEQSAALQNKLIQQVCTTATQTALCPVELWCTPNTDHPVFRGMAQQHPIQLYIQEGRDLGERMYLCQQHKPNSPTLILGTDCPYLNKQHLTELLQAVIDEPNEAAIMPALDGGYVAIACKQATEALFKDIDWGTEHVFGQTRTIAEQKQLGIHVFNALSDIDNHKDYRELCKKMPNMKV